MSNDGSKLAFYSLLSKDAKLGLMEASQDLKVPVPTLRKWKKEYTESKTIGDIDALINTDPIIIEEVAKKILSQVVEVVPSKELPPGELLTKEEQAIAATTYKEKGIKEFTHKVTNLQILQTEVQSVAANIVALISIEVEKLVTEDSSFYSVKDIALLTNSLTSIQNSFFNRPTTVLNNFNTNTTEINSLTAFRESLKP